MERKVLREPGGLGHSDVFSGRWFRCLVGGVLRGRMAAGRGEAALAGRLPHRHPLAMLSVLPGRKPPTAGLMPGCLLAFPAEVVFSTSRGLYNRERMCWWLWNARSPGAASLREVRAGCQCAPG